jgi:hypothetical protein
LITAANEEILALLAELMKYLVYLTINSHHSRYIEILPVQFNHHQYQHQQLISLMQSPIVHPCHHLGVIRIQAIMRHDGWGAQIQMWKMDLFC